MSELNYTQGLVGLRGISRLLAGDVQARIGDAPNKNNPVSVPPMTMTTASGIKIHHIQTGYVAVKSTHREYGGHDGRGISAIAIDRNWTEWLPISVWVIEHPEGVIVIDTGESCKATDLTNDYFNCDVGNNLFYRSFLRFSVNREEEIDMQLRSIGIAPHDVRWVIQTHLHSDHMDGLPYFTKSEVLVSGIDYPNGLGVPYCHFSSDFDPTLVSFSEHDVTGFNKAYTVTQAEDVLIVPTPGHTLGHQSVIFRDGDVSYFFAGDSSFSIPQIQHNIMQGIATSAPKSRQSYADIRAYCQTNPTVYLPSHDHESRTRLQNNTTV